MSIGQDRLEPPPHCGYIQGGLTSTIELHGATPDATSNLDLAKKDVESILRDRGACSQTGDAQWHGIR